MKTQFTDAEPLPEGYESWSIHEKRKYRMRIAMRRRTGVKEPYFDEKNTGLPRSVRIAGGWEAYKKQQDEKRQAKLKKKVLCNCGKEIYEGRYKKHLDSGIHHYYLHLKSKDTT